MQQWLLPCSWADPWSLNVKPSVGGSLCRPKMPDAFTVETGLRKHETSSWIAAGRSFEDSVPGFQLVSFVGHAAEISHAGLQGNQKEM